MSEEILFELPGIRITTEQVILRNATLGINRIASTEISEQFRGWWVYSFLVIAFVLTIIFSGLLSALSLYFNPGFYVLLALFALSLIYIPKEHVLKITLSDKMFYEIVVRTHMEAEIIQKHVHVAIYLSENITAKNTATG